MHRPFRLIASDYILTFGGYLLLTWKVSVAEVSAGAVVALLCTAGLALWHQKRDHHLRTGLSGVRKILSVPPEILRDCFVVFGAIFRRPALARGSGRFREDEVTARALDPEGRGRRAVGILAISAAPNRYVIGIDPRTSCMLSHELVPQPHDQPSL